MSPFSLSLLLYVRYISSSCLPGVGRVGWAGWAQECSASRVQLTRIASFRQTITIMSSYFRTGSFSNMRTEDVVVRGSPTPLPLPSCCLVIKQTVWVGIHSVLNIHKVRAEVCIMAKGLKISLKERSGVVLYPPPPTHAYQKQYPVMLIHQFTLEYVSSRTRE